MVSPTRITRYVVLDTPDITPLGHLFRLLQKPDEVIATLVLRDNEGQELRSAVITRITEIEHERERGGIFFVGMLDDGRRIRAYVFATPEVDGSEVVGSATISEN